MIVSPLRVLQSATLLFALHSAQSSFSQSVSASLAAPSEVAFAVEFPDAPSFSSSQQQTAAPAPQQTQPPPNETEEQKKQREREEAAREVQAAKKQRIGGIIPDFNNAINGQGVALTKKQKLDISFHTITDPYAFAAAIIIGGGFGELADSHPGYGHGAEGFFKRVGASYADNSIGNLVGNGILPALLHQDPRYFRKGTGSIMSRIVYSAMTSFICHGDNGKNQPNVSNVLGNFIAGGISNAYYPSSERGVELTINNALIVTAEGMVGSQLLEFAPDVTGMWQRHRARVALQKQQAKSGAAAPATPPPPPPTEPEQ